MASMLATTSPDMEPEDGRVVNQEAITKIREVRSQINAHRSFEHFSHL